MGVYIGEMARTVLLFLFVPMFLELVKGLDQSVGIAQLRERSPDVAQTAVFLSVSVRDRKLHKAQDRASPLDTAARFVNRLLQRVFSPAEYLDRSGQLFRYDTADCWKQILALLKTVLELKFRFGLHSFPFHIAGTSLIERGIG